ncbi:AraC family transcriptional regulator [Aureliella helgolandensis]|uniref:Xylose operon regulatory protein n=1 Tax=Aureliella helgolandensis TaxID=2527968 RepID=A0A518G1N9_9BACT|nr:DNA-binding transcriptional regulator [Aureliella helgolandensis]QDV22518.1 Xylose operon regulatory protein [Aureliella helgolandensis]
MHRRSVALLVETSNAYARGLLEGVVDYVRQHDAWSIYLPEQERGAAPPAWLSRWSGDGIIARIETDAIATAIQETSLPVVDVSAARRLPNIPWVETDDKSIAELAFKHLADRGFQRFAYCGDPIFNWSIWREKRFVDFVIEAGYECDVYQSKDRSAPQFSWTSERDRLMKWMEQLPKPIGIMACYDIMAQRLLDVCHEQNIAVPEEAAIIGVDNDHLLCNLSNPPLTSIECDSRKTGYEAASLLDRLMSGEAIGEKAIRVEPVCIETRLSTDTLAIDDPIVAKVVRYIREHASAGINVSDLLPLVPWSRRVLESRFQKILGRTPHEEITRIRLDRVKHLLRNTDLTLSSIARQVGYEHEEYLSAMFKKQTGMTASDYRSSF